MQELVALLPAVQDFLQQRHGLMIGGQTVHSAQQTPVYNPATGEVITQVSDASEQEVDQAVNNAWQAFNSWSRQRPAERERLLLKLADVLEAHAEELAQLETLNQGKSIHIARAIEVGASIEYVRYMAGWTTKIHGETMNVSIPMPAGARYTAYTRREPVGVVAGIVPWNFPLMIALWKIVPALACGCTIVLKPSTETPLTALRLAQLVLEAGIPAGVVNVITGQGSRAGAALATHPGVRKVTFTGSTAVGKQVGHAAVDNMTRFSLELGGKNPMIVLADADVDQVVQGALTAGLLNQGQVCAAASRFYIHRSKYRQVTEGMAAALESLRLGPGLDLNAQVNPLVSAKQQKSVQDYIALGYAQGAQILGSQAEIDLPGFYVRPTLLIDAKPEHAVVKEEIFGP
ncbi:MAG: aldehyde dehydrogenase family protein, partial [Enterobacteriaceae bacterium]